MNVFKRSNHVTATRHRRALSALMAEQATEATMQAILAERRQRAEAYAAANPQPRAMYLIG